MSQLRVASLTRARLGRRRRVDGVEHATILKLRRRFATEPNGTKVASGSLFGALDTIYRKIFAPAAR